MPKAVQWSKWYLVPETQRGRHTFVIKRYRKEEERTIWQRYPRDEYRHLKPEDLEPFVTRLNGERTAALKRAEEAYQIKHQFITEEMLAKWDKYIHERTTSEELANAVLKKSQRFLHFFINQLGLVDPLDWYERQGDWGAALLSQRGPVIFKGKARRSKRTIDDHVNAANRFMKWLHRENPRLFPLLKFDPIAPAVLRDHDAERRLAAGTANGIGKYVKPQDWETICKKLDPKLLPFVKLAYLLNLRRAETLGVKLEDIRQGYFSLERQLKRFPDGEPVYGPPKNRKSRQIPYWLTSPDEIYDIVANLPPLMHPDTLTERLSAEMRRIGLDYEMHDFRRTAITKALRDGHAPRDVQLAAGHADLKTTMRYVMEDRELASDVFVPKKRGA